MSAAWFWLAVPGAPLLIAFALLGGRRAIPWLALGCLPALAMVLWPMTPLELPWLLDGVRWGAPDGLTRAWLGFTTLLWLCAGVFAIRSQARDARLLRFWTFWQLALAGNLLLIIAADALSFYVGFSLMSLAAYGLIVQPPGPGPRRAGRLYLQLAVAGEMALLAALMLRAHAADGAFGFTAWSDLPLEAPTLLLLLFGLGLKAGFWPLHVWLPLAHPAAPAPASAVLSGAMIKAGLLGLWRCLPEADPLLRAWAPGLLAVGLFGAFYAVLLGLCAQRAKAALAYSSVSQMGWFLMVLALAWRHPGEQGAVAVLLMLFGVHHGLAKGALFLAAGLVHDYRLPRLAWALLALPALALAGLPLSSGAAVKAALKTVWYDSAFAPWLPLLGLASAATALLLARALWLLRRDEHQAPATRPPAAQWLPWALLSSLALVLPWLWPRLRSPLLEHLTPADLWSLGWPLLLALVLAVLALRLGWCVPQRLLQPPQPALRLSLRLKRLVQQPPLRALDPHPNRARWRGRERHWNRFWSGRGPVAVSLWLIAALLWLGWLR